MLRLLGAIFFGYLCLLIFLYLFQRNLIYVPSKDYISPNLIGLNDFEEIKVQSEYDESSLTHWYKALNFKEEGFKGVVIFFHGNAGSIVDRAYIYRLFAENNFEVLAFEYRGYGVNAEIGKPNEADFYKDAESAINYLIKNRNVNPEDIILVGESLGSGIAVEMATKYQDSKALILISPFASLIEAAKVSYPYVPVKLMLKDKYNSIAKVNDIKSKTIIFHGDRDRLIPIEQSHMLLEKLNVEKNLIIMENYGHNDLSYQFIVDKILNNI
jgi:hypothetical protein